MTLTRLWRIETTVGQQDHAASLARTLIDERLAACVQQEGPITSTYRWEGRVASETEWRCVIKTTEDRREACVARLRQLHPYTTPQLVAWPLAWASDDYAAWVLECLSDSPAAPASPATSDGDRLGTLDQLEEGARSAPPGALHLQIWCVPPDGWGRQPASGARPETCPFEISFETAASAIGRGSGIECELDGSWVWPSSERSSSGRPRWQLDGMLYDRGERLEYVEVKGEAPWTTWCGLLRWLSGESWPSLAIYDLQRGSWHRADEYFANDR